MDSTPKTESQIEPKYQLLYDTMDTVKNLCETVQFLLRMHAYDLLPTQLEYIQLESQDIIEQHCVAEISEKPPSG